MLVKIELELRQFQTFLGFLGSNDITDIFN